MALPRATRVVLSVPDDVSDWARDQFETDRFRGYFRRVLDDVAVGDVTEEFVDVGCCGDSLDIPFRVERIETADGQVAEASVGDETDIEYATRESNADDEVAGGWRVQSQAGPT
ncbi:MAG: hypothetical protein ABEH81_14125 [Halopenitus sp.]